MTALAWVAVAVGGAVGAPLRFLLDRWITERTAGATPPSMFPWGLLAVNATGSAVAGVALALTTGTTRTLLLVGLCGAFTTFSGFAWESERLWTVARSTFWWAVVVVPAACFAMFLAAWRLASIAGS